MKPILLIGKNGQIGHDLLQVLHAAGHSVAAIDREACNMEDPDSIVDAVRQADPSLIINAAAYTAVDKAEAEPSIAAAVNGIAPGILAQEAKRRGIPFVHFSTDYVFDGAASHPYKETDAPNPLSVYGRTKLQGEQAVAAAGGTYLILRTSWIYAARGRNFYLTMRKLAGERDEVRVVDDQHGTPNWSLSIAEAAATALPLLNADTAGLYHLSGDGSTTWYGFASRIFARAPLSKVPKVTPISTAEYPTAARRPPYSVLDSSLLAKVFGIALPPWESTFDRFIAEEQKALHR